MRKNTASQNVSFQMTSSTDGSAVTSGTPTVYYTIDGGAQGTGAGTSTHEGNGEWGYVPAQAETNGDHVAFTMTLSGAINQTVNVYPVSYDPTQSDLGLNNLSAADVNAEVDTALADYDAPTKAELDSGLAALNDLSAADVNAEVDTALADYDAPTKAELDAGFAALNDISAADVNAQCDTAISDAALATAADLATVDANVDAILLDTGTTLPATLVTIAEYIDTEVAAIKAVTDNLPDSGALTSLATASALATVDSNVDAILLDTGTNGVVLSTATQQAIADEVLTRGVDNVEDSADAHSLCTVVLAATESSRPATNGTWTIYKTDGVSTFTTKTVTVNSSADPIVTVT
mgnify:CR=1 FL=1